MNSTEAYDYVGKFLLLKPGVIGFRKYVGVVWKVDRVLTGLKRVSGMSIDKDVYVSVQWDELECFEEVSEKCQAQRASPAQRARTPKAKGGES